MSDENQKNVRQTKNSVFELNSKTLAVTRETETKTRHEKWSKTKQLAISNLGCYFTYRLHTWYQGTT